MIEKKDRDLPIGTVLVAKHKDTTYRITLNEGETEGAEYWTRNDDRKKEPTRFKTPSGAGMHIMGGIACNGWRFFGLESETETPVAAEPGKAKRARRSRAQIEADNAAKAAKKAEATERAVPGSEHQEPAEVTLGEAQEVADSLVDAAPAA